MATHKRRVPAAAMMPETSDTTFHNQGIPGVPRWVLRSADPNPVFFFYISDVKTDDTFTKLSLAAALLDNSGTFQAWAALEQFDEHGVLEPIAMVRSKSTGGLTKVDSVTISIPNGVNASPKVDLTKFTYLLRVGLINSSPSRNTGQIVVPWLEYTYKT